MKSSTFNLASLLVLSSFTTVTWSESPSATTADPEGETETSNAPSYSEPGPEPESEPESEPEAESESGASMNGNNTGGPEENSAPEAEGGKEGLALLFVSLYSVIIIIILVGNILVALTILKNKNLRTNESNLYLLSLVTARASIAIFVIPARITGMFSEEYLGDILCRLCHFAALGSGASSVFSIVAIAISKYFSVMNQDSKKMSLKKSILITAAIWLLGFGYAIRAGITNDLYPVSSPTMTMWTCSTAPQYKNLGKYFIIMDLVCLFLIPLFIITYCYTVVIKKMTTMVPIVKWDGSTEFVKDKQSIKASKMLVILMSLFIVCTAAPMVLNMYTLWGGMRFQSFLIFETFIYMFSYSNSWFNLIVFAYFRDDLRNAFISMIKNWPCYPKINVSPKISQEQEDAKAIRTVNNKTLEIMEF